MEQQVRLALMGQQVRLALMGQQVRLTLMGQQVRLTLMEQQVRLALMELPCRNALSQALPGAFFLLGNIAMENVLDFLKVFNALGNLFLSHNILNTAVYL
ncbi:NIF3-like protein 1 [Dissostichus eleginoides]|uniref:NIF3-like protein 1 n=1 Tax=Dissostichus eleginoides TaxID=100907 RepID=A0AAD9BR80_DISEL|nr:NIF3-like protein 1 [Dissostichus eleginoides]